MAATTNFGIPEITQAEMTWPLAESFIAAMNSQNGGAGYLGISSWRQPTVEPIDGSVFNQISVTYDGSTDMGTFISAPVNSFNPNGQSSGFTGNELAYHYYNNFLAIGSCSGVGDTCVDMYNPTVAGIGNGSNSENLSLFGTPTTITYWTGTEAGLFENDSAFMFSTTTGLSGIANKFISEAHVWPVTDGDVGSSMPNELNVPTIPFFMAMLLMVTISGIAMLQRHKHRT